MARVLGIILSVLQQPRFSGLLGASFVLGLAASLVVPFMSMWGTLSVGMRPFAFGLYMTVTALSGIAFSTLLARWSDTHVARRTMIIIGGLAGAAGYIGYAYVRDLTALIVIGSLATSAVSVSFSQLFAFAREEIERAENPSVDASLLMSLLRVFYSLAWTGGPALGAMVMVHFSYQGIFLAAAGLYGLFLLAGLRWVPHRPHAPTAPHHRREPLRRVLTRPVILVHYVGFVLLFSGFTMNMMNLPLLVTQQLGGTAGDVGFIFGIAPFLEIPLMIWFSRLAARGHQVSLIRFGVLTALVYFAALIWVRAPWHIYPMQFLSAASIAITTNVTITFFQDRLPGQAGIATSIYANCFAAGNLIGYLAFGVLLDGVGHRGVFVACVLVSAVTLTLFMLYRHPPEANKAHFPGAGHLRSATR